VLAPTFAGVNPPGSSLTLLQPEIASAPSPSPVMAVNSTLTLPSSPSTMPMNPSASATNVGVVASGSGSAAMGQTSSVVWIVPEAQKPISAGHFASLDVNGVGLIGGVEAKEFFLKSSLPASELAKIWALSDVNGDGKLSLAEFQVAFFLTQQRANQVELPSSMPTSLYESVGILNAPSSSVSSSSSTSSTSSTSQQTQHSPANSPAHSQPSSASNSKTNSLLEMPITSSTTSFGVGTSGGGSPNKNGSVSDYGAPSASSMLNMVDSTNNSSSSSTAPPAIHPIHPTHSSPSSYRGGDFRLTMRMDPAALKAAMEAEASGNPSYMPSSSGGPSSIPAHLKTTSASSDEWLITAEMKATYDSYFLKADEMLSGFVSGPRARELFTKASLPNGVLAEIWALSDMNKDGQLDKAEFAVAMHLINLARRGIKPPSSPANVPLQMLESAGVNTLYVAELRKAALLKVQKEKEEEEAKQRAQLELQQRQHQLYLEQAAFLARQEEEKQEVTRMKSLIASMLQEKSQIVSLLRQQQQHNIALATKLAKADYEAEGSRVEVSMMELEVEKAKIKGASIKEHSDSLMRNITAASEDKATLESILQQKRSQFMTETAALTSFEQSLNENKQALSRQVQDIASLRSSISALERAKDERASRAFDPQVLQQKLLQEKLKQDFAAARGNNSSSSLGFSSSSPSSTGFESIATNNGATGTSSTFPPVVDDSSWAAFPTTTTGDFPNNDFGTSTPPAVATTKTSSTGNLSSSSSGYPPIPLFEDDFGTSKGSSSSARPSFDTISSFQDEQDEFGKPSPQIPSKTTTTTTKSSTSSTSSPTSNPPSSSHATNHSPFPTDDDVIDVSSPITKTTTTGTYPQPDDDFFSPNADDATPVSTTPPTLPSRSTNPFPVEDDDEIAASVDEVAVVQKQQNGSASPSAPPSSSSNPFPSSESEPLFSNEEAPVSSATSKAFDDLFADVPATETSVSFGSPDDLFGPSSTSSTSAAPSTNFKNAFDEKLFDD
jgi:hypothetical protein